MIRELNCNYILEMVWITKKKPQIIPQTETLLDKIRHALLKIFDAAEWSSTVHALAET